MFLISNRLPTNHSSYDDSECDSPLIQLIAERHKLVVVFLLLSYRWMQLSLFPVKTPLCLCVMTRQSVSGPSVIQDNSGPACVSTCRLAALQSTLHTKPDNCSLAKRTAPFHSSLFQQTATSWIHNVTICRTRHASPTWVSPNIPVGFCRAVVTKHLPFTPRKRAIVLAATHSKRGVAGSNTTPCHGTHLSAIRPAK